MSPNTIAAGSSLLVPDVVHRPSETRRLAVAAGAASEAGVAAEPRALDRAMRHVRMSLRDVLVIDDRDLGKGDIYVVTLVTDNIGPEPVEVAIRTFADIGGGEHLALGPAGFAMYRRSAPLPTFLDYRILVAESDEGLRDAGAILDEVRADSTFKSFRESLISVIGAPAPAAALATATADFTMQLVARLLKANRDDQLIYIAGSFDDAFDNLGVPFGVVTHRTAFAEVKYVVEAAG